MSVIVNSRSSFSFKLATCQYSSGCIDHNLIHWKMRLIMQVEEEIEVDDLQEGKTIYLYS